MAPTTLVPPTQHIYRGRGGHALRTPPYDPEQPALPQVPTIADLVPACRIMSREVVCARDDLEVTALMDLMMRRHIGCVPIVDDRGHPIGMVTKLDLVEYLVAARAAIPDDLGGPFAVASQLMMPLAITLDEHATVAHVAAMMSVEGVHHVPIVAAGGALIGVVSTMDVMRWLTDNDRVVEPEPASLAP
jgi:CBS domain-containing protein